MANPFETIENRLFSIEQQLASLFTLIKGGLENTQEDNIGVTDAAKMLKISVATLYIKTSQKQIPHSKPGKHLIFSRKQLQAYIGINQVKTLSEEINESENLVSNKLNKKRAA